MSLWLVFLTGLTSGGLSCLAMQGGLLASVIANQKDDELAKSHVLKTQQAKSFDVMDWLPVTLFLLSKLFIHTVFGFFLGWIGSQLELNLTSRLLFQGLAALFMLGTAFNLLDVHPIFRYLVFQPPRFIRKLVKNSTHGKAFFTPLILGLFTLLVPCGVTQSMEVLAVSSGNPWVGAAIMFFFVLGTSPLFAIVGVATAKLSETFRGGFLKIAAAALIILSISSLNGILVVLNSPVTIGTITSPITYFFSKERFASPSSKAIEAEGVQRVTITITNRGYEPRLLTVKNNIPVELTLRSKDTYSCALAFVFKEFGINTFLEANDVQTFSFTPTKKGKYRFSCSMGMYTGVMEVI